MNRYEAQALLPFVQALAEGKTIQMRGCLNGAEAWIDAPTPTLDSHFTWRVKPTPKMRQWTLAEIPIGALIRRRAPALNQTPQLIVAADILAHQIDGAEMPAAVVKFESADNVTSEKLLARWEWQYPGGGLAWLPCGIEVVE